MSLYKNRCAQLFAEDQWVGTLIAYYGSAIASDAYLCMPQIRRTLRKMAK